CVVHVAPRRDLVERLCVRAEADEVVDALFLLLDRIGEPAPAPHVVALERPAALLDQAAQPVHGLGLLLVGELRVQQQQNLVLSHAFPLSFPRSESAPPGDAAPGSGGARRGRKLRKGSSGPGYDGSVRRLFGWRAGLTGIAASARLLAARRDRAARPALSPAPPAEDPAEELRRKLAQSRGATAPPPDP